MGGDQLCGRMACICPPLLRLCLRKRLDLRDFPDRPSGSSCLCIDREPACGLCPQPGLEHSLSCCSRVPLDGAEACRNQLLFPVLCNQFQLADHRSSADFRSCAAVLSHTSRWDTPEVPLDSGGSLRPGGDRRCHHSERIPRCFDRAGSVLYRDPLSAPMVCRYQPDSLAGDGNHLVEKGKSILPALYSAGLYRDCCQLGNAVLPGGRRLCLAANHG